MAGGEGQIHGGLWIGEAGGRAEGELEEVEVAGWKGPAYLRSGQAIPRADRGTALLCPFDPLIFFRPRVLCFFNDAATTEIGFFAPWSWWPFFLGLFGSIVFAALAIGWWLFFIGFPLALVALIGFVFEFHRGQYAH